MSETRQQVSNGMWLSRRWATLLIIALAIIPRVLALGVFRIIDEDHLWEWTEQFVRAVLARDWAGTAITAYPGLPFFWVQFANLGLEMLRRTLIQGEWIGEPGVYLVFHEWGRETFLGERRLLLGIVNGLLVIWLYWLVRRLLGERVGFAAGVLLALDPFLLSESRVARVEALSAEFVGLTLIALLLYFRRRAWRWLVLSGVLGGLALATKSQNLLLVGFVGLAIAGFWLWHIQSEGWRQSLRRLIPAGFLWLVVALLIFVLIWPAMWVEPAKAIKLIVDYASAHASDPEYQEVYFLGQTVVGRDPGALFYVVVLLLRMTPWTLIGLVGALVWLVKKRQPDAHPGWQRVELLALLAFIALYMVGMSFGAFKQTRYLLPVFPTLGIVAAVGWVWMGEMIARRWLAGWSARRISIVSLATLLGVQAAVVLPHHPYYYDFYNPLLGGGPVAVRLLRVGWGEGMDQVAAYLNTRPNPDQLTVAARFGKYMVGFQGRVIMLDRTWQWLQADYIVFYVQQVQKMIEPSPGVIRYFQRQTPEHVVRLGGIDYAWVYPNPVQYPADPQRSQIPGKATLLGYAWQLSYGQTQVKVLWENDGLGADEALVMRLVVAGGEGGWHLCQTAPGSEEAVHQAGEVAESLCPVPQVTVTTGVGGLEFGIKGSTGNLTPFDFSLARSAVRFNETGDVVPLTRSEMYAAAATEAMPATATRVWLNHANRARLVGYEMQPQPLLPGDPLSLTLYWQALQPIELDFHESVKLLDPAANVQVAGIDQAPPVPTTQWWPGTVVSDTVTLSMDAAVSPPVALKLDVGLVFLDTLRALPVLDGQGREISRAIGWVKVLPHAQPDLRGVEPLSYVFGEALVLEGMRLVEAQVTPGGKLLLELYWSVQAPVNEDYTVFVHVLDGADNLVGQGDGPPVNGRYPTSAWSPGEVILDVHTILVSDEIAPGRYRLVAGLYRASDGARLLAESLKGDTTDAVIVGEVYVQ